MGFNLPIAKKNNADYNRPSDWISIPSIGANEEVAYLVGAIMDTDSNYYALTCTGAFTVDWGDGTIQNYASGAVASKLYTYSSILSEITSKGYKTVLVKVTPQSGQTITLLDTYQNHPTIGTHHPKLWLEINSNFASADFRNWAVQTPYLEAVSLKRYIGSYTNIAFLYAMNLQYVKIVTNSATNVDSMFRNCYKLNYVEVPFNAVTSAQYLFTYTRNFKLVTNGFGALINGYAMYLDSAVVKINTIASTSITNMDYMFKCSDASLTELPSISGANVVTLTTNWLNLSYKSLRRSQIFGLKVSHSYANQLLSATALNEIFTNLGTANAGATITITGNPGSGSCTTSIATAKGWTIIN